MAYITARRPARRELATRICNAVTAVSTVYPLTFVARLLAGVMGGTLRAMLLVFGIATAASCGRLCSAPWPWSRRR